jgi:hypothetical protein
MTGPIDQDLRHLWEYHHPYHGAAGNTIECASFAELRDDVDASEEDLNRIYRRDWIDHTQPYADDLCLEGEDRSTQTFTVSVVTPAKSTASPGPARSATTRKPRSSPGCAAHGCSSRSTRCGHRYSTVWT